MGHVPIDTTHIKFLLRQKKMTITELAERMKVARITVYRALRWGNGIVTDKIFFKLAKALEVLPEGLIQGRHLIDIEEALATLEGTDWKENQNLFRLYMECKFKLHALTSFEALEEMETADADHPSVGDLFKKDE